MRQLIFLGTSCCVFILLLGCLSASAEEGNSGMASFYSAVPVSSHHLTAAHRHLPFGTRVRVTRIDTGKHVIVRINDRGPFVKGRIIDVSRQAAELLGMIDAGVTRVRLEIGEEEIVAITHVAPPNSTDIVDAASP
jgi:rare lipoprotein A